MSKPTDSNAQMDDINWFQPTISPSPFIKMGSEQPPIITLVPNGPTADRSTTNPFRTQTDTKIPSSQLSSYHDKGHPIDSTWFKSNHSPSNRSLPITPNPVAQKYSPPPNAHPGPFQPTAPPPSTGIYIPSAPPLPPGPVQKSPVDYSSNLSTQDNRTVSPAPGKPGLMAEIIRKGGFQGAGLKQVEGSTANKNSTSSSGNFRGAMELALDIIRNANAMSDDSDGSDEVDSTGSWSEEDC